MTLELQPDYGVLERGLQTTGRQTRSIRQRSGSAARPKPAANTAHKRQISEATT